MRALDPESSASASSATSARRLLKMSSSFVLSHQTASTYRNVRLGGLIPCGLAEGHFEQPVLKMLKWPPSALSVASPLRRTDSYASGSSILAALMEAILSSPFGRCSSPPQRTQNVRLAVQFFCGLAANLFEHPAKKLPHYP